MNLFGREWIITNGMLSRYTLRTLSFEQISGERYFAYILLLRMKAVVILFLLAKALPEKLVAKGCWCLTAFTLGCVITMSVLSNGIFGCPVVLAALFPHGLFYFFALYLWEKSVADGSCSVKYFNEGASAAGRKRTWILTAVFVMLILLGCMSESYLNPLVFEKVINL